VRPPRRDLLMLRQPAGEDQKTDPPSAEVQAGSTAVDAVMRAFGRALSQLR
jgi:hypothetical protein